MNSFYDSGMTMPRHRVIGWLGAERDVEGSLTALTALTTLSIYTGFSDLCEGEERPPRLCAPTGLRYLKLVENDVRSSKIHRAHNLARVAGAFIFFTFSTPGSTSFPQLAIVHLDLSMASYPV